MKFEKGSFEIGGKVVVPHSFVNSKEPAEIVSLTDVGMAVLYKRGTTYEQRAFYSYAFLAQQYGDVSYQANPKNEGAKGTVNDLNDEIPFDL